MTLLVRYIFIVALVDSQVSWALRELSRSVWEKLSCASNQTREQTRLVPLGKSLVGMLRASSAFYSRCQSAIHDCDS